MRVKRFTYFLFHFLKEPFHQTKSTTAGIYLLKVSNRNTRTRCEIFLKVTIKTPERRHWRRFGVFIVDFEHISHLVFLLWTLNIIIAGWEVNPFHKWNHIRSQILFLKTMANCMCLHNKILFPWNLFPELINAFCLLIQMW